MGQTETALAKFVLDFPTQDVPADVMHLAKRCLMNYSGVALLANLDPAIDILLDVLRAEGCAPAATVIGKGFKTSVQNAARSVPCSMTLGIKTRRFWLADPWRTKTHMPLRRFSLISSSAVDSWSDSMPAAR